MLKLKFSAFFFFLVKNLKRHYVVVLCIKLFSDIDGVLKSANGVEYGLASGVFTEDVNKAMYVSKKLDAGTVFVNVYNKTDVAAPFGGFKQSGFGKDLGNNNFYINLFIRLRLVLKFTRIVGIALIFQTAFFKTRKVMLF